MGNLFASRPAQILEKIIFKLFYLEIIVVFNYTKISEKY